MYILRALGIVGAHSDAKHWSESGTPKSPALRSGETPIGEIKMADTMHALEKNPNWKGRRGPVVLVIMDGVGYGKYEEGDAVKASKMKYLDWFTANCPHTKLKAHGTAVGLPSDDDMGNSEVGHNDIGCGRVFA